EAFFAVERVRQLFRIESRRARLGYRPMVKVKSGCSYDILWESDSRELPAGVGWEKVSIGAADMRLRGRTGSASKDVLVAHEFAVVLTESSFCRGISGI